MFYKPLHFIVFLGCILAVPGQALADTLQAVVERTLASNPDVLADRHERKARDQELVQARSGYGPTLELSGALGVEESDNSTVRAQGKQDETLSRRERGIQLRQMLFDGFATRSEVERQRARVTSSAYTLLSSAEQIALRTAEVYLDVLRRTELVRIARENLAVHETTRDQIELRSRSGIGRRADVNQVTGRYALAMANVISEESNLADARSNYLRVTGELPDGLIKPASETLPVPDTMESAVSQALATHPTLLSAEADVTAAQAQHQAARNTLYPRLDVEAGQNWNNNLDGQRGDNDDRSVMLRMRYLLFSSGREQAKRRQTAYLLDEAREVRNNTRRQVTESIRLSWNQFQAQSEQLDYLKQHVESTKRTLEAFHKQFNIGKRTLLDLLDSQNELFDAKRALINTRYDWLFARYRIQAGMGRLLPAIGASPPEETSIAKLQ